MGAEADALCGAGYGERSTDRTNSHNGTGAANFTRGQRSSYLAIPKWRHASYFPDWLLERRERAERPLTVVVAACYLRGYPPRRTNNLVEKLGITGRCHVQGLGNGDELDTAVEAFRTRPLEAGPYHVLLATGTGRAVMAVAVDAHGAACSWAWTCPPPRTGPDGRVLAVADCPRPLRPQEFVAAKTYPVACGVRSTGHRIVCCTTRSDLRGDRRQAPRGRRPPRSGPAGSAGVYCVPQTVWR